MNLSLPPPGNPKLSIPQEIYSDSRTHGYQGPNRSVRLRVAPSGGGAMSKSEDDMRCVVTGKESLRILRLSEPSPSQTQEHKSFVGPGGHRIDASRNFWDGSGLKIDSASTDVAWCHGLFNNKIVTSARNGELIMWDLNKAGPTKYERRTKDHIRSINKLSVSYVLHHYCVTGSADGDMRVWDLRDISKSLLRVHHPTSVRSVVFSPNTLRPLQAVVGLDNGSIYRWDLKMGQRGQLDRIAVAHTASVTTLDWCDSTTNLPQSNAETSTANLGWIVSGGLDRCVKVWDLDTPTSNAHIPHNPTYTLHPPFPIRRVLWRPQYGCEVAIVSNAEFAAGSNTEMMHPALAGAPGMLTRVGSSIGLDTTVLKGSERVGRERHDSTAAMIQSTAPPPGGGESVEIWDVRRGWIAKWSTGRSAADGSITDFAFRDSHAVWAQHTSGTFSQIDLRQCTRPLDAIPRVSAVWEASGSMAFVAGRRPRWEVPYDDINPDMKETNVKAKALGDSCEIRLSQSIGTFHNEAESRDMGILAKLAGEYIFEGSDRPSICAHNAQRAYQVGKHKVAQAWLLLGASVVDIVPTEAPTPSKDVPTLAHSVSAPAAIPNSYSFPSNPSIRSAESAPSSTIQNTSPGRGSIRSIDQNFRITQRTSSTSTPRRLTPTSSNSSSPRNISSALPSITPRQPSIFGRRESVDSGIARRRSSLYRRPSMSIPGPHSSSPGDRSGASHRHVGEGALDDSDSDSNSDNAEESFLAGSSDEDSNFRPLLSPSMASRPAPTPSPLSRIAVQQHWTEDEGVDADDHEDEASPSPRSTDTESGGSSSPHRRPTPGRPHRRNTSRMKSRSRSSTVASLAAPVVRPALVHQESYSSIRTVTAGEISFQNVGTLRQEETIRDLRSSHQRQKSLTTSENRLPEPEVEDESPDMSHMTERRIEVIRTDEQRFRNLAWDALREVLEAFADEGDVQTCAMFAVVAGTELRVSQKRMSQFLDSYIDILMRLRLPTCAAYLRKYTTADDIRNSTLLETTVYTSCGKCRKPLVIPAGTLTAGEVTKGGYSYCLACKSPCTVCSICRLPVRSLLFQCSVCTHGGHQACYQNYYLRRPMVDLPNTNALFSNIPDVRGRTRARHDDVPSDDDATSIASTQSSSYTSSSYTTSDSASGSGGETGPGSPQRTSPVGARGKIAGYPCAAGCGHFCWAANNH
ncbi:hypothetical protein BD779DRAFT_1533641 [Infundibulicybe gibba]|nr:hypothetical protein BD779DRAFT_1533641 [Infundibulicybe gibba]